jgi:GT2 family glycosyltransferase
MTPPVDVIIVSYNTRRDLDACLASLAALIPTPLGRVVVVDNASTDGTVDAVRRDWPHVDLVALDTNIGFGAANNIGFARCTSTLVLLLNSDTFVPPGAIETLAERLAATGAAAAGPRLVDRDGRPEVSFGPMLSPLAEARQWMWQRLARSSGGLAARLTRRHLSRERFVDWVTAACCLVVRQAAVDAGLFDERYFMYEEDVDFCAALRAHGSRILFTPAAEVVHARGQSAGSQPASTRRHYDRSHQLFYEKHLPGWASVLGAWKRLRGRAIR